jgi:hypothetical protein
MDGRHFPEAGGLMSYSPDFHDMARRTAVFVDKLFEGRRSSSTLDRDRVGEQIERLAHHALRGEESR